MMCQIPPNSRLCFRNQHGNTTKQSLKRNRPLNAKGIKQSHKRNGLLNAKGIQKKQLVERERYQTDRARQEVATERESYEAEPRKETDG